MREAAAACKEKIGGPFKALSVEIEKDSVKLRAQDPRKPAHVDEYRYAGASVAGPKPVELSLLERDLGGTLFDFDSVDWVATEPLAREAVVRTQLEGGAVTKMSVERGLSFGKDVSKSGPVHWTVEVRGTRESATAFADAQGKVVGLDLSQTARAAQVTMFSADALREAENRIKHSFGGDVKLVEILVYDKFLSFKAVDPQSGEINEYKYDINGVTMNALLSGVETGPPVFNLLHYKLEDVVFGLGEIELGRAPDLGQRTLRRLNLAGGRCDLFKVSREPVSFPSPKLATVWDVSCQQGRKSGTVIYDLNGKEVRARVPE